MPTISLYRDILFQKIGKSYTDKEFDELCFEFGIELDEVVQEDILDEHDKPTGQLRTVYKIEIPANRYDLLCVEGLSIALRVFLRMEKPPLIVPKPAREKIYVKPEVAQVRPYVVCAVLRNIEFTEDSYKSFIELQDKLHQNICRRRTLVAIGTHDYDTIKGPFTYEALPPTEIKFIPLCQTKEMNGVELMSFYEDTHLKPYLPIIRDSPVFPVIYDANRVVCSLPPVINGDHSKITLKTKNVFFEATATDLTKANTAMANLVSMFSVYCTPKFEVEQVEVVYPDGTVRVTPELDMREMKVEASYLDRMLGNPGFDAAELSKLLGRMMTTAEPSADGKDVIVKIPPYRADILHACDIMEDTAISYGFQKIPQNPPPLSTVGRQQPMNKLTDLLRHQIAQAGFTEALTLTLLSREENYAMMRKKDDGLSAGIANPKTLDFQIARTSLLPGLIKTVQYNKGASLPLKLFEFSDVVHKSNAIPEGAVNKRYFSAIYAGTTAGFEIVHGLLDRFMEVLGHKFTPDSDKGYFIRPAEGPSFYPGRCAEIVFRGQSIGMMGVLHPEVLIAFGVPHICSALEINMHPILDAVNA